MHYCNSHENFTAFNFLFDVSLLKICFWLVVGCVWVFTVFLVFLNNFMQKQLVVISM